MISEIETRLRSALNPTRLNLEDESREHEHHRGAKEHPNAGHYSLLIVAEAFEGKNRVARHRLVYGALGDLMQTSIHALKIDARAPSEPLSVLDLRF